MKSEETAKMTEHPSMQDPTTVAGHLAKARRRFAESEYIEKTLCTDVLLDCLNVAVRPPVRAVILEGLPQFSHGNLATLVDFTEVLDEIQLALQIDAAFDEFELSAS